MRWYATWAPTMRLMWRRHGCGAVGSDRVLSDEPPLDLRLCSQGVWFTAAAGKDVILQAVSGTGQDMWHQVRSP